jgi:hypothetical protein
MTMSDTPPDNSGAIMSAAEMEAEANRNAAQEELSANRPNQQGPQSTITWTNQQVDANTGEPITQLVDGTWVPTSWYEANGGNSGISDANGGNGQQTGVNPYLDMYDDSLWGRQMAQDAWNADNSGGSSGNPVLTGHVAGDRLNDTDASYRALHDQRNNPGGGGTIIYNGAEMDPVTKWNQETLLRPEWQASLDSARGLMDSQMAYRGVLQDEWSANPVDFGQVGGANLEATIGRGDLDRWGSTNPTTSATGYEKWGQTGQTIQGDQWQNIGNAQPTLGAQDWRQFGETGQTIGADQWKDIGMANPTLGADDYKQFGTSDPTIGADDWQQFGNTENTIGKDDWREFGNTEQTLDGGTYDERFGDANSDPTGGYGSHSQDGSDWNQIEYTPDAIRRQAEQETMAYMNSQLDPQWDKRQADLEQQLANKGLQWGDAAYDSAMSSQKNSRDQAYAGARNQALADSRSEASMLWGQEMQRSDQLNQQTQADVDNIYRARQANIGNYGQNQSMEQQNYLAYQQAAFGQDLNSRQQQLDANLNYGREDYNQDFNSRQQSLNANLDYGREGFQQDFQSRQQQLDADRNYGNDAFMQDLQSKQQGLDATLGYGREAYQQDYQSRQQNLDSNRNYSNDAFSQDLQSKQQGLDAQLDYGSEAWRQDYGNRQQNINSDLAYSDQAYNQDRNTRQDNITNYLNYGNSEFNQNQQSQQLSLEAQIAQEQATQGRYGLVNPNETSGAINAALGR